MTEEEMRQLENNWKSDVDLKLDRADMRQRIIERLVWVATGGITVLSAVSVIGITILFGFAEKLDTFGRKLELVSSVQAVSMVEYRLNEEQARQKILELQQKVELMRDRK